MKRPAIQERIEFHLLKTARRTQAFLVTGGCIAGGGFPLGFSLRALQNYNVSWHDLAKSGRGTY